MCGAVEGGAALTTAHGKLLRFDHTLNGFFLDFFFPGLILDIPFYYVVLLSSFASAVLFFFLIEEQKAVP